MKNNYDYDVIIVGAGPAGMFAANELSKKMRVLIIDKGKDIKKRRCAMKETGKCIHCKPCNIMCGVGGSGTFSDGTLNLRPDIGGDLIAQTNDVKYAWELIKYIDEIFLKYGAPKKLLVPKKKDVERLKHNAASAGAEFIEIPQRHIGSDRGPKVIGNFSKDLIKKGVEFLLQTEVVDLIIKNNKCKGVILKDESEIKSCFTIIAPGRVSGKWINDLTKKQSIEAKYSYIDVGVRVEVRRIVMDHVTKINRDPKFYIRTKTYDDLIRTFCTNEHGFVVKEEYDGFVATNGHSFQKIEAKSQNTNFAFLVRIKLTEPLENTTRYGRSIAKLATTIGGGKPVLQRMGDLRKGRRTTSQRLDRNLVKNTLEDVTPGDISMALPHRIVTDIVEGLETLNKIIPGVAADSTLLYAPEIKFYAMQIQVDKNMQSSVENLFAAGDGAGQSRDIVNAAATGILAARGILKNSK